MALGAGLRTSRVVSEGVVFDQFASAPRRGAAICRGQEGDDKEFKNVSR